MNNIKDQDDELKKDSYAKLNKRLNRIIKQSDKQQLKVLKLNEELDSYKNQLELKVKDKTEELHKLNADLEIRIETAVKINRLKDKQISEQAKFVQIGELMSNIAHHWRQPLNTISTSASGILTMRELGLEDKDDETKSITQIIESTKFLSNVIKDFSDFINDDQNLTINNFSIQDNLNKSLNIIISSLENNNINVIKNYPSNDIRINTIESKLSNSIINIFKNAEDALVKIESEEKRIIEITIIEGVSGIQISIKDNANGIEENILSKVFDPYFTTKHQSEGTGLGLYTTKDNIEQHLKGHIQLNNSKSGVEILITLPKNI